MSFNIVYDYIGSLIKDLDHIPVPCMHDLICGIYRKGHILSASVPVRIYQRGYRTVGLGVEFLLDAIAEYICTAEF